MNVYVVAFTAKRQKAHLCIVTVQYLNSQIMGTSDFKPFHKTFRARFQLLRQTDGDGGDP